VIIPKENNYVLHNYSDLNVRRMARAGSVGKGSLNGKASLNSVSDQKLNGNSSSSGTGGNKNGINNGISSSYSQPRNDGPKNSNSKEGAKNTNSNDGPKNPNSNIVPNTIHALPTHKTRKKSNSHSGVSFSSAKPISPRRLSTNCNKFNSGVILPSSSAAHRPHQTAVRPLLINPRYLFQERFATYMNHCMDEDREQQMLEREQEYEHYEPGLSTLYGKLE
jgi:hypothetical protein